MSRYRMTVRRASVVLALLSASTAIAAERTYDFKDPKGVNSIAFVLDSLLEPILGLASGVSGTVKFDPVEPGKISGKIQVDAATLHTQNKGMNDAMHGPDWLETKKNASIDFAFKEVKEAKKSGENSWDITAVGDLTCKGITKPITVMVKAAHHPGRLGERLREKKGDLLVLRSSFVIKRSDFGIKPDITTNTIVADDIEVRVSIVGAAADS